IRGEAVPKGRGWEIKESSGKEEYIRKDIFLDRGKKIPAPKNEFEKDNFKDHVKILIAKYEKQLAKYESNEGFKKVSPSYDMGHKLAKGYIKEYRQIYASHFRSNAIKFILDDWVKDEE
ncbi:hypothetical protein N9948_02225, partial [bacterium]|nr:hypothetical protein [bacterium]